MTKDLTVGSPFRQIVGFAFPLLLGILFQQFYTITDTIIVGKLLGVKQLAGVGSTGALSFLVLGFCNGVCSGFAIPIAQKFGAGQPGELRRYMANALWTAAAFALVLTTTVCLCCPAILRLMNTPDDIFQYAYRYILVIFLGIPATFLYNILAGILRSLGDSRSPVLFLALSSVMNIALDLLFIAVLHTDVVGPALATVLSQAVSGCVCLFYMRRKYPILHLQSGEARPSLPHIRRLCYLGIPMGLQYSVTAIGSSIIQRATNSFGSSVVAGVTAAQRLNGLLSCPIEALGGTMAPYAGQNVGAGKYDRLGKGAAAATLCGVVSSAVMLGVVLLWGKNLVALFLDAPDAEVIACAYRFLLTAVAGYTLLTLVNVLRLSIQGMGFSVLAICSGIMELLARSSVGLLLVPRMGFGGLCLGHPSAWLLADLFLIPAFFLCKRRVGLKKV